MKDEKKPGVKSVELHHDDGTVMRVEGDLGRSVDVTIEPPSTKPAPKRKPRGFAAMDRARVSAIASKGGKAAHAAGTAHQFSREEAQRAGRKGGTAPHVRRGRGPRTTEEA